MLQDEFPELKKRYWGQHLWARGYFCATVGNVTEEIIRNYIANQFTEERNDIFKIRMSSSLILRELELRDFQKNFSL